MVLFLHSKASRGQQGPAGVEVLLGDSASGHLMLLLVHVITCVTVSTSHVAPVTSARRVATATLLIHGPSRHHHHSIIFLQMAWVATPFIHVCSKTAPCREVRARRQYGRKNEHGELRATPSAERRRATLVVARLRWSSLVFGRSLVFAFACLRMSAQISAQPCHRCNRKFRAYAVVCGSCGSDQLV